MFSYKFWDTKILLEVLIFIPPEPKEVVFEVFVWWKYLFLGHHETEKVIFRMPSVCKWMCTVLKDSSGPILMKINEQVPNFRLYMIP